jgi:very-short-patch-repair endonuclease
MAAVLAGPPGAALSHGSAAALLGLEDREGLINISFPSRFQSFRPGLVLRRAKWAKGDVGELAGIPVTSPIRTLIDLATVAAPGRLEAAVNAADKQDLVDPEQLRDEISGRTGQRGVPALRRLLDESVFALTDSELERRFLRLVRAAGLPKPKTGVRLNGFKVDFFWPGLGLVVETDGLRYHRTPSQQVRDRRRDQVHMAAGLTALRFTHFQVAREPERVAATLRAVLGRSGD